MESAVVVDVVRTPLSKRRGSLAGWHPADLLSEVLNGLIERTGLDPGDIDDVIAGCVSQVGAQSTNIARNAILAAGWPDSVPGTTVDRQCGSSMQAVHFAAQGVMAGVYDIVVAAGIESMSVVPMFSNASGNLGDPYGPRIASRYADADTFGHRGIVAQGLSAELLVERFALTRAELDSFALESHLRAATAQSAGRFDDEIIAVQAITRDRDSEARPLGAKLSADDGVRTTSLDSLAALPTVFREGGALTAGNSSQISDGAAAALIMSESRAHALGLTPLVRLVGFSVVGCDPIAMLTGPIAATSRLLHDTGRSVDDIALFEINEAFAPVVLAWAKELKVDLDRVNVNGGAIALGHPLGATGVRLLATLAHELVRSGERFGAQAICEGGGMANAMLVERVA